MALLFDPIVPGRHVRLVSQDGVPARLVGLAGKVIKVFEIGSPYLRVAFDDGTEIELPADCFSVINAPDSIDVRWQFLCATNATVAAANRMIEFGEFDPVTVLKAACISLAIPANYLEDIKSISPEMGAKDGSEKTERHDRREGTVANDR